MLSTWRSEGGQFSQSTSVWVPRVTQVIWLTQQVPLPTVIHISGAAVNDLGGHL